MVPRRLPLPNLTAVLAVSALADLVLYRVTSAIFLPSQDGSTAERWTANLALFFANFSGLLALILAVVALVHALGSDQVFPRSMRITVSTVGLFFCSLAAIGVLWNLAPQYGVHLRISHGFLAFFLAFGVWHGQRPWRAKLGVTLFAIPLVIQALALFVLRMAWTRPDPGELVRLGHAVALTAAIAAPVLVAPWPWRPLRAAITIVTGVVLALVGTLAIVLRFDLVQAALFYGLRIDMTGLASTTERLYSGALVTAFACLGAGIASCLWGSGRSRLAGWGLLLVAAAGTDITSPKPALFSLCGLLAMALASATSSPAAETAAAAETARTAPAAGPGSTDG
jgi:hypothetical protein